MRHTARRFVAALLTVFGAAALLIAAPSGIAQAAPVDCGYPAANCACPTLSVSTTLPQPGGSLGVSGTDFVSNRTITLVLKPVRDTSSDRNYRLRSVRTRADGTFATTVTMPKTAIGTYDVVAVNGTPRGATTAAGISCPADPTTRVRFGSDNDGNRRSDSTEPGTAFTGLNVLWLLLLAGALVVAGGYANRRGKKSEVRSIHG